MKQRTMTSTRSALVLLAAGATVAALHAQNGNVTERVFVSAGRIEMQLGGGSYSIRPAADTRIRVTLSGNTGRARVEITSNATRANLAVMDTPGDSCQAAIEVPKVSDLIVRLSGGNFILSGITGNKDVDNIIRKQSHKPHNRNKLDPKNHNQDATLNTHRKKVEYKEH